MIYLNILCHNGKNECILSAFFNIVIIKMKCLPKTYVFAQIQSVEDIYTVLKESEYRKNGYIYIYFFLPPSIFYNVIGPFDNGQRSIAIL